MFKNMKKHLKNEKGLTLIELLAVIVILAIIAAIAVPAIGNVIANSRDSGKVADLSNALSGAKIAVVDGTCTEQTPKGDFICSSDQLKDYLEGLSSGVTISAERVSGEWTIKQTGLGKFNSKKYGSADIPASITEADLNNLLENGNPPTGTN